MSKELKSTAKFFAVGIIAGIVTLFLPVLLWNVWFLDYINTHGKLVAWLCAPVFAFLSAAIVVGLCYFKLPITHSGDKRKEINPFWGWAGVALVIEIFIVLGSNT
jgi:uncharacterized membrane protein